MYLVSAMYVLERHRTFEADRRRELREALQRGALLEALASDEAASDGIAGVPLGDRAGRRSDPGADLGWGQDLHPAAGPEQRNGRLVRPVQAQPEP